MKTPTEFQLNWLMHLYDPVQAHKYYEEHKHLKGRKKGVAQPTTSSRMRNSVKTQQKVALQAQIQNLESKLAKLEELIRKKETAATSENRKSKAKQERATKEKNKPQTAADKAKIARDNAKYRDKHKTEIANKAKSASSSGSSSTSTTKPSSSTSVSIDALKTLATKVRGQIAVAKQKLAAL